MPTTSVTSTQSGLTASSGVTLDVVSGGTLVSATILSGGSATIQSGGIDAGSVVSSGGSELVFGSAGGDIVYGSQTVSTGATVSGAFIYGSQLDISAATAPKIINETVENGGSVELLSNSLSASGFVVLQGGTLTLSKSAVASNTTISGGTVVLTTQASTLSGGLIFSNGGTLDAVSLTSTTGDGPQALISGFAAGDVIEVPTGTTLSFGTSGGNTVASATSGGFADTFTFSGTAILADLVSTTVSGIEEIADVAAVSGNVTISGGVSSGNISVASGATLTVLSGGTVSATTVLFGGSATISAGGSASVTNIAAGGTETILGSASGDSIAGIARLNAAGATASNETVQSGGLFAVASGTATGTTVLSGGNLNLTATAANTTIAGGTVTLQSPVATIAGSLTFANPGTLAIAAIASAGAGDQAVISGFTSGDAINLTALGTGATLSSTVSGGNTVATVTSGAASETLIFAGSATSANLSLTSNGTGGEEITYSASVIPTTSAYIPGDLVISIVGDGAGTGSYTDNQASPIVLEQITTGGTVVSQQVLPQTTYTLNGVTEYAISGEYGSSSEGTLQLAANGQSFVIAGYGINAATYNAGGAAVYGNAALAQTTSFPGGRYIAVARVVADISANASVDTSTALFNVYNTNNPRSVTTVNGTVFYLGGQGDGGSDQGVYVADDGASGATAIYTASDVRDVELVNGQLDVSIDSKTNGGGNLDNFGATLPTSATTPSVVPGIGPTITVTSGNENGINNALVGSSVYLSPEQYFFANASTLYIADGGNPKEGGLGDGGLQKWSLVNGTWVLDYTLTSGLNLVPDTSTSGTSGLIGLTGTVVGGNVLLYTTNETIGDLDQTYLYTITDTLSATTLPTSENFSVLETAAPDTNIRGVVFAPTASSTLPQVSSTISVTTSSGGLTVASGGFVSVASGGTISGLTLLSGGSASIASGGTDSATFVGHGATELVLGSASFDVIDGTQTVSNATALVTSETIENGGTLNLFLKGAVASATTVNSGGALVISGNAYADNTIVSGGTILLESGKGVLSGTLSFLGTSGTIAVTTPTTPLSSGISFGDLAVISGFAATDVIDERAMGAGSTLSTTLSGGNTIATISSGSEVVSFTLAGSSFGAGLALTSDGVGGVELTYTPPAPQVITVSNPAISTGLTITSGGLITVLSGGTMSAITIAAGASASIASGGVDSGSTISNGGTETVLGSATGDLVLGYQNVSAATAAVSQETIGSGGVVALELKTATATGLTVLNGGTLVLNGNVYAVNTLVSSGGVVDLQSPKATISGSLTFAGPGTLEYTGSAQTSAAYQGLAVISGFAAGDVVDQTLFASATLSTTISGGNTVATITSGGQSEEFLFAGTAISGHIGLTGDGGTGVELTYLPCFRAGTRIMTEAGEAAVEDLRVGDRLRTASGATKPIVWIGQRRVDCARHPRPRRVWPVLVRAGAFAEARPSRDLYLSPDHSVFVDGVLIPVGELVNGDTVRQIEVDSVEYYHVELDLHDVILAEGLAVESFLDGGNRAGFANGGGVMTLHPDFAALMWDTACAELVLHGPRLAAVRVSLAARAANLAAHRAA